MEHTSIHDPPVRITDLVRLKEIGATITCRSSFEIVLTDFVHRDKRFRAFIFLCRFAGTVDGKPYTFRKCYARGCPHNLCPHVNQAVMIANRYLTRDYRRLEQSGMDVESRLFSLEDMLVKFADLRQDKCEPVYIIDDYIRFANEGNDVSIDVTLEYVPATEHFEYHRNLQTFLMADFAITRPSKLSSCQRCLACYPTEKESEEKQRQMAVANDRLTLLYSQFDEASIVYERRFFQ